MTGDAWWNDKIRVAVNEKKQAYLRKLNIKGLSYDERIKLEYDFRDKKRKAKMLSKEIRNYFIRNCARKTRKEVVVQSKTEFGIARVK